MLCPDFKGNLEDFKADDENVSFVGGDENLILAVCDFAVVNFFFFFSRAIRSMLQL